MEEVGEGGDVERFLMLLFGKFLVIFIGIFKILIFIVGISLLVWLYF